MEAKLKAMLGDFTFAIAMLTAQLEAAQKRIKELEDRLEPPAADE